MSPAFNSPIKRAEEVFDYRETMVRLGEDVELYADLVRFFQEDADELRKRLREKLAANDRRGVELCAHSLKGLCSNFGARRAVDAALALEEAARSGVFDGSSELADELEAAVLQLKTALSNRG